MTDPLNYWLNNDGPPYLGPTGLHAWGAALLGTAAANAAPADALATVSVLQYGAVGDDAADDTAAILAAFSAAATFGAGVWFPAGRTYKTTAQINITAPVRVTGYGATLHSTNGATAIRISSSYVTIAGLRIEGTGAGAYQAGERGILSLGTEATPYVGCKIVDVEITAMGDTAIRCDWWVNGLIDNCYLHDLAYAGILVMSGQSGTVRDTIVEDVWQHDQTQSYGISITDNVNTVPGRSRDWTVQGCTVKNVANWLGMGTHGGERIMFVGNRVIGCHRGITFVAGNPDRVVTSWSCTAVGNVVDGTGAGGSDGIAVAGLSTGAASTVFRSGNLVSNHANAYMSSVNGYWLEDVTVQGSDGGYPIAASAITAETVVDRITVQPSRFARNVHVASSVYATSTDSTNRCEVRIYLGSTVIGRTRRGLASGSLPEVIPAVGAGVIPAGTTPVVIEVRVAVNSGSGTMSTTVGSNLTTSSVVLARV